MNEMSFLRQLGVLVIVTSTLGADNPSSIRRFGDAQAMFARSEKRIRLLG
jgi:hypothetical protein